jgi:hypothetical protein
MAMNIFNIKRLVTWTQIDPTTSCNKHHHDTTHQKRISTMMFFKFLRLTMIQVVEMLNSVETLSQEKSGIPFRNRMLSSYVQQRIHISSCHHHHHHHPRRLYRYHHWHTRFCGFLQ